MLKVHLGAMDQSHFDVRQPAVNTPSCCKPGQVLQRSKSSLKANVFITTIAGKCVVVKDYSASHPLLRATLCKWFIRREIAAIKRLQEHPGVPEFVGPYGQFGFGMELIEGRTLDNSLLKNNATLLRKIDQTVTWMHFFGVGHNDIRNKNLILDRAENLFIVDFASAVIRPNRRLSVLSLLYKLSRFSDRIKLARFKQEFSRQTLKTQDRPMLKFVSSSKYISRLWKKHIYRFLKPG